MENNPIYENTLRHFLNFKSPNLGRFEITEPINFDSFAYKIKQANNRFGRDKEIAGDEIDLEFIDVFAQPTNTPQVLTNGFVTHHLSHRLDLILEAVNSNGSECEIEYILQNGNQDFVTGLLDIPESTTDGYSYFKCSVVQNTSKALIERKKDVKVDVFSDKDTFGDYIEPLQKERILLRNQIKEVKSEWVNDGEDNPFFEINLGVGFQPASYFNYSKRLTRYDIRDTYVPFEPLMEYPYMAEPPIIVSDNFKLINVFGDLSNIEIKIKINMFYDVYKTSDTYLKNDGFVDIYVVWGDVFNISPGNLNKKVIYSDSWTTSSLTPRRVVLDQEFIETIPNLQDGQSIWFACVANVPDDSNSIISGNVKEQKIDIKSIFKDLDIVTDSVKYFDFLKQGIKSLSKLNLEAPSIETGEFKDQFVFNGNMLRLRNDVSLNFEFSDEMNDLQETNSDYQIFDDKVLIQEYPEFYRNVDLGAFYQVPEVGFEQSYNDRFKKITMEYGYKNFEQNKDQENTINAFQTESQWLFPNKQVDDELKVDINCVRDYWTIETMKTEAISNSTALSSDSKIVKIDCVLLPENSRNSITRELNMLLENTAPSVWFLKIRSNGFSWLSLGFSFNSEILITSGENIGRWAVWNWSPELLELTWLEGDADPDFSGLALITLDYPLNNVSWVNRTNEDFSIIENINAPDGCSNLKYSIKRNLSRPAWSSYLNTICSDYPNGSILNTDFEVNGDLKTQFNGGQVLIEKDPMQISTLAPKIINKTEISTKIKVGFYQAKEIIDGVINKFGFIRVIDTMDRIVKLYPKQINMLWSEGVMDIVGEVKAEIDIINVYFSGDEVIVDGIGYDQPIKRSLRWFKIDASIYVQLFDNDSKPLINPTDYRKISINGVLYTNEVEFYNALNN